MQVSVIIPTFNRRALLGRALDSVLGQSTPAAEVIVVDDGSDDGTAAYVRARYPQVQYFWQPRAGVSAARNRGIAAARSEWIALLDSDDSWQLDKLARQIALAWSAPRCRLVHCDENWLRDGEPLAQRSWHQKRGGWIFEDCLPRCVISPSAALMHRSLFDDHGGFDESLPACEDYDLWLRITAREAVAFVPAALVNKIGGHADQLSRTVPALDRYRIQVLARLLEGGRLDAGQALATRKVLAKKLEIYIAGAAKRGRHLEVRNHVALRCRLVP